MRKEIAIAMFGRTQSDAARALGISRQAVSQWPEELRPEQVDRVVGAAVRLGLWRGSRSQPQEAA